MESASAFSTSCSDVACEVQPKNAALRTAASPLNLVAVGRKLDRIHNYEANLLEGPKLPLHATSENADNCLPAPRCIRATLFGKVDDLQFAPFRGHILTRIIRPSRAWLAAWLRRSLWRRRDHEPAAICDSGGVVRNDRSRGVDRRLA